MILLATLLLVVVVSFFAFAKLRRPGGQVRERPSKLRRLLTPEGVTLDLEIGSAATRLVALIFDLALLYGLILIVVIALVVGGFSIDDNLREEVAIVLLLLVFALRYFWFIGFEAGPRAATPGKRLMGLRVVARDGGTLDFGAVVARNLIRDLELMLPLSVVFSDVGDGLFDSGRWIAGSVLTFLIAGALLFNRDRMRIGDIIAGTWVVVEQRRKMASDLTDDQTARDAQALAFTPAELSVYGVYELQTLETLLRRKDAKQEREAADAIRRRLGRPLVGDDRAFLEGYYHAARMHMERELLFGAARADKHARRYGDARGGYATPPGAGAGAR